MPRRSQRQPPAFTHKQRHAQARFQLADAGGDVGLHPMQTAGGAGNAAFLYHCLKNTQVVEIHGSCFEMVMFWIIHFTELTVPRYSQGL